MRPETKPETPIAVYCDRFGGTITFLDEVEDSSMYYIATLFLSIFFITATVGHTADFSFIDTVNVWPGYEGTLKSGDDVVGNPEITGGSVTCDDDDILESVVINYEIENNAQNFLDLWSLIAPEDLFFDLDCDGIWDVVVTDELASSPDTPIWNVYAISTPIKPVDPATVYDLASDRFPGTPNTIRGEHPVALASYDNLEQLGTAAFSPAWITNPALINQENIAWTFRFFDDKEIVIGESIALGWTVNCGNDVVYTKFVVPLPAALAFLTMGVSMLGVLRKKGIVA